MSNNYLGITIGPIYDTLMLTSKPAGLWGASYLFSYIARRLCEKIAGELFSGEYCKILVPYVDSNVLEKMEQGIGLLHDRIIVQLEDSEKSTANQSLEKVKKIIKDVKVEVGTLFAGLTKSKPLSQDEVKKQISWVTSYVQIHAVVFSSNKNPILDSALYLDGAELMKSFPNISEAGDERPLVDLFADEIDPETTNTVEINRRRRINENVRNLKRKFGCSSWPLTIIADSDQLPDMKTICGMHAEGKRAKENNPFQKPYAYYAIVQSDGDEFGKYIGSQVDQGVPSRNISKKCVQFAWDAANIIQAYGGFPIYAGGDDLLFIAPLWEKPEEGDAAFAKKENGMEVNHRKNLIHLLRQLQDCFEQHFGKFEGEKGVPTISFGVAVRYYKYPLYEAFGEVYDLLTEKAKKRKGKNACAFSLRKHSGQSADFILPNYWNDLQKPDKVDYTRELANMIRQKKTGEFLKSVLMKLHEFRTLFVHALKAPSGNRKSDLEHLFRNTFDSSIHAHFHDELEEIRKTLDRLADLMYPSGVKTDEEAHQVMASFDAQLRLIYFYAETGKEDEQ